jgi:hypothetical protein
MTRHRPRAYAPLIPRFVLAALFAAACFAVRAAHATPPSPQLDLDVTPLSAPVPGRPVTFAVEVTPLVEGETIRIRVRPPADCALTSGDTLLVVRAPAQGETRRFEYAIAIPSGVRRYVYVRADLVTASGRHITRGKNLVLVAGPLLVPDVAPRVVSRGAGESGLEFDGAPVPQVGHPVGPTPPGIGR